MRVNHIVVIVAMEAEAAPIKDALGARSIPCPWPAWCPMTLARAEREHGTVSIVVNGQDPRHGVDLIGTQAATLSAAQVIEHLSPDIVISAGTCGGFIARGGRIGDVYLAAEELRYHDRRVPLPGFHESSLGSYPTADLTHIAKKLDLKQGVVTTGDALDATEACMNRMNGSEASVKEMEAAAIGWICSIAEIPVSCIKSVTDLVDGETATEQEFIENLTLAVEHLAKAVTLVTDDILKHGIEGTSR